MTPPKNPEIAVPPNPGEGGFLQKLPAALRRLLVTTPDKEWPKIRAFLIESEEEGELVEMLPEINHVMKLCPAKLMGRVGRREISADQLDKAYTQFHDSIHAVRQALYALLELAGFRDYRPLAGRHPGERHPISAAAGPSPTEAGKDGAPQLQRAAAGSGGLLPKPLAAARSDKN